MRHDFTIPNQLGEYRLLELIGGGPCCGVWRAQRGNHGDYALKVLHPRYAVDQARVAHFEAEARLAFSFDHPNIIRVLDVVTQTDSSLPFFVMDRLRGGHLGHLKRPAAAEFGRLIRMLIAAGKAMGYIHRRGLVHCDIKPSNILLDDSHSPYLTDFGMTASLQEIEEEGPHGGTLLYMSPEQFENISGGPVISNRVDPRSDIYSFGVLMYELFSGEIPSKGHSRYALMYKRMTSDPVPPSSLRGDISSALERIILCSMARDPTNRFSNADELVGALEETVK